MSRPTPPATTWPRLHSGDLSIYSAVAEQIRRLQRHNIAVTLTPGVPAFAAAAAALGVELTVPGLAQSVVLTRLSGRASPMPERRDAGGLRRHRRHARNPSGDPRAKSISSPRSPRIMAPTCPVAIVVRASCPDQRILRGTLADIEATRSPSSRRSAPR